MTLNSKQFEALATLMRMREGATKNVAREVLVKGQSVADAARTARIDYVQAYKVVQRARKSLELVLKVAG